MRLAKSEQNSVYGSDSISNYPALRHQEDSDKRSQI